MPLRELIGFKKVMLRPAEMAAIEMPVTHHDLTRTRPEGGGREAVAGDWVVQVGDAPGLVVTITVTV